MQADVLDILFENRNKSYGAYALRKNYNHRLGEALVISLGLTALLLIINSRTQERAASPFDGERVVTVITEPYRKPKPPEPEPPRLRVQPPRAQVQYTNQVQIVDDKHPTEMPSQDRIDSSIVSTTNVTGMSASGATESITTNGALTSARATTDKPEENTTILTHSEAQFPGGTEAFKKFLAKNLMTPDDLEIGEKKNVLVRFLVDIDGAISRIEILHTDGEKYSKEVIRVLNKMPRWIPAMQNGVRVITWFSQPVTFIGVE